MTAAARSVVLIVTEQGIHGEARQPALQHRLQQVVHGLVHLGVWVVCVGRRFL